MFLVIYTGTMSDLPVRPHNDILMYMGRDSPKAITVLCVIKLLSVRTRPGKTFSGVPALTLLTLDWSYFTTLFFDFNPFRWEHLIKERFLHIWMDSRTRKDSCSLWFGWKPTYELP